MILFVFQGKQERQQVLFGLAAWMLYVSGFVRVGLIFIAIVIIHSLVSYDRISWLINH